MSASALIRQLAFVALNVALVEVPDPVQALAIVYTSLLLSAAIPALTVAISTSTGDF